MHAAGLFQEFPAIDNREKLLVVAALYAGNEKVLRIYKLRRR
jgi:hypothetical protein